MQDHGNGEAIRLSTHFVRLNWSSGVRMKQPPPYPHLGAFSLFGAEETRVITPKQVVDRVPVAGFLVPPLFLNAQTTRHEHLAALARDDPLIDRYHCDKTPEKLPTWMLKTKKHRAGAHLLKHMFMITSVGSLGKGSYRWYAKNA